MIDLSHLPEWITTLVIVVPLLVAGGLAVLGITEKKANERTQDRQTEADALQEKIRALYLEESKAQDDKIKDQAIKIKGLEERLATVEGENRTFRSVISGTDDQSREYRKRVESTLALVDKLSVVILQNKEEMEEGFAVVNANIERLAKAIESKP